MIEVQQRSLSTLEVVHVHQLGGGRVARCSFSMSPKAIPDKAILPDFPLFPFFLALIVGIFCFFRLCFCCFSCVCGMPRVDPHVPHMSPVPNISTLAVLIRPGKNQPKMPVQDPQNEFPGIPCIGPFLGISI